MEEADDFVDLSDYKAHSNLLKDQGNEAFQKGEIELSISLYSQAINLDPDNHLFYSNRSAAYMKADSKSKSLRDAEKCVELAPNWSKGYNRLGIAQQSLSRFELATDTFKKGLEIDPENQSLWTALRACQEAHNEDKKQRYAEEMRKREEEEALQKRKEEIRKKARQEKEARNQSSGIQTGTQTQTAPVPSVPASVVQDSSTEVNNEEDLLAGFFSEVAPTKSVEQEQAEAAPSKYDGKDLNVKYRDQELGDSMSQLQRIMAPNYQFRNLNPYYVLQLGVDATNDDIKMRYRKLSTKVHPDKLRDMENAREAFEEVKKAYQRLMDEKQRDVAIMNIEYVENELIKERRKLVHKGLKESSLPPFEEEFEKRTMKHFAEIEMARRRAELNLRGYNARERIKEDEEKAKLREDNEREEKWADIERREKRVGNWREFQEDPEAKKVRLASYKEENRKVEKHGVVKTEQWKKSWK